MFIEVTDYHANSRITFNVSNITDIHDVGNGALIFTVRQANGIKVHESYNKVMSKIATARFAESALKNSGVN